MSSKLPKEAFVYYATLGSGRSFAQVADRYGVSKALVAKRAKEEDWASQLEEVEQAEVNTTKELHSLALDQRGELYRAISEVMTPSRIKAVLAALLRKAIENGDVACAKVVLDRTLGKVRESAIPANTLAIEGGLHGTSDVRRVANLLLEALAEGRITPEEAQKAASVVESARKAVETEDLEIRLEELELKLKESRR